MTAAATLSDPQSQVRAAVKSVAALATLPEVTARIVKTVEDPKSTAAQLHTIISHDPALVTRILKVVNSSFYGLPGQIGSVERAIVLLGLNAVKNIAVAASLGQLFRGVKLCEGFTAKDLWTHCMAVAVAARDLARQLKLPIADEAFLAGMIHDIGILVALQLWPERVRQVCEMSRKEGAADFCTIERQIHGFDHQQLGAALSEHWKFPRSCQLVAGYHHTPSTLGDDRKLVSIVCVADTIVCRGNHGFNLTAAKQELSPEMLKETGLEPALVEQTGKRLPELISAASAFMA